MTVIEYCMARVQRTATLAPPAAPPEAARSPGRRRGKLRQEITAAIVESGERRRQAAPADPHHPHFGRCIKTVLVPRPAPEPDLVPSPKAPLAAAGKREGRLLHGQLPRFMGMVREALNTPSGRDCRRIEEDKRMAQVEAKREVDLLRTAHNTDDTFSWQSEVWNEGALVLRQKIARCETEIQALDAQPHDIPDKAWLVAMGRRDWEAEKASLEKLLKQEVG